MYSIKLVTVLFIVFTFVYTYSLMVLKDTINIDDAYFVVNEDPISVQVSVSAIVVNNKNTNFVR